MGWLAHGFSKNIDTFTIAPQADVEATLAAAELLEADSLSAEDDAGQVDDLSEENIPADDADDEDDADDIHNLDDINPGTDNDEVKLFKYGYTVVCSYLKENIQESSSI